MEMEMEMERNEGKPYGDEGASCRTDILGGYGLSWLQVAAARAPVASSSFHEASVGLQQGSNPEIRCRLSAAALIFGDGGGFLIFGDSEGSGSFTVN
ncbi:hypothetical protein Pint_10157 [Pistacia integerrima]|uniref:Uncharacterized protein n=1 Tax=Pistacia integerrima TaxID=434235 RepID=A0ACC0XLX4_9ROSI|nr:hypothetical protein Pint_10157 [Pistacia integerrima]